MIVFHEGLPRSGKSYEAMVRHIAAALAGDREVWAYIEGINHAKVAEASGLELAKVERLLHQLTRDQVPEFYKHVTKNSLIVLDEAQNFWPNGRGKLDEQTTQAITEHGHLGQDILLMGQSIKDVHALWRRRISQKVIFNKLDALGSEQRYAYTVEKATSPEKFVTVTSGISKYDSKWFGSYASHVDSSVSTLNYKDDRANLRKSWMFSWGMPIAFGVLAGSFYMLSHFFQPEPTKKPAQAAKATSSAASAPVAAAVAPKAKAPKSFIVDLNERFRPRLAFYWKHGEIERGRIEWYDGKELRESLTFDQIRRLGGDVWVEVGVARVAGQWVTAWSMPLNDGYDRERIRTVVLPSAPASP